MGGTEGLPLQRGVQSSEDRNGHYASTWGRGLCPHWLIPALLGLKGKTYEPDSPSIDAHRGHLLEPINLKKHKEDAGDADSYSWAGRVPAKPPSEGRAQSSR